MKTFKIPARFTFVTLVTISFVLGLSMSAFSADCLQKRKTPQAPEKIYNEKNPLEPTSENISAGEKLYLKGAKPLACAQCHGEKGNGLGKMAAGMTPKPRDFSCAGMMKDIPDGQLFWVIQNGSKGTGMMGFKALTEEQIWQLVLVVRKLSS